MEQKSNNILSRPDRVKRGFHRIGVVFLLLFVAIGASMGISESISWGYIRWVNLSYAIAYFSLVGMFFYIAFRSIGWIVAGFLRD
jgi:hypothetical protein